MKLFFSLLIILAAMQVFADEALESSDFSVINQKIRDLGQKHGVQNVLVVYDLDNTLLAMNTDLGSDQWYDWQAAFLKTPEDPNNVANGMIAKDQAGLLKAQGILYAIGSMRLTQADLPERYAEIGKDGYPQVLLTSRGPDFRDSTEREILRNALPVFDTKSEGQMYYGMAFDPNNLAKNCLTEEDKTNFKLSTPRALSIGRNVIMSSGQHKGMILKVWLCLQQKTYKAVVFADDKQKNVDAMIAAYGSPDDGVELVTFRYSAEDARVNAFMAGDKADAKKDWANLALTLGVLFNSTF